MVRRIQGKNSAHAGNLSFPVIGNRHIAELKTRDLLVPIKAVEDKGFNEVAMRLQQRTITILRYAVQQGILDYNPVQEMSGAITTGKRAHRPALPFERYHAFLERIDGIVDDYLPGW